VLDVHRLADHRQQLPWALQAELRAWEFPQLGVKLPRLFLGAMSQIDPTRENPVLFSQV